MKSIAFILAMYISFLTVQPLVAEIYSSFNSQKENCTMSCCKHKQADNTKQDPDNCCNKGVCNPFGMCNCCFVFNQVQTAITYPKFTPNNELIPARENNLVSSFISDCFHPPEIA